MSDDPIAIPHRPDPREAPALFRRLGLAVHRQLFLAWPDGDDRPCACYAGALLVEAAGGYAKAQGARSGSGSTFDALVGLSGLPRDYAAGLAQGFSFGSYSVPGCAARDVPYRAGVADGHAAFLALREAGMVT